MKPKTKTDNLSDAVTLTFNRFFRGRAIWHGALWTHVARLTVTQALWRPAPQRHCIWEIVRHIIFWRQWLVEHAAGKRIPNWKELNWTLPQRTNTASWRTELRRLRASQGSIAALFGRTSTRMLLARNSRGKFIRFWWLGVLAHDSYHTGQIATIRAVLGLKPID